MKLILYICIVLLTKNIFIMSKSINISGIKVVGGGLKGLEVNYVKEDEKDGKRWLNDYWQGRKVPIGEDLERVIKGFRYYLLDVYGYELESVNVGDVDVTEINFGNGWFVIKGLKRLHFGDKHLPLKTAKIRVEDEYEKYSEVENLVGQLQGCVQDYMDGKSEMSSDQLVMRFYEGKGKATDEFKASFESMSKEDREKEATRILEDMGHLVILNSEVNGVDEIPDNEGVSGEGYVISDVQVSDNKEVSQGVSNSIAMAGEFGQEDDKGNVVPMFGAPVVNVEPVVNIAASAATVIPNFDAVPKEEVKVVSELNRGISAAFKDMEENEEVFTITPLKQA